MDTRNVSFRCATLDRLTARPYDLLVIGGGITGAGIARDAAMRGFRTALIEARDLASGTSSLSSRLIHGGLRYLEQGQFHLVREATRERRTLLTIAPHLVRPLPFVFPVHKGDRVPLWKLAAGMFLYDLLAPLRNVRRHRILGKRALLAQEPMLRERGLVGGARYYDAQCDDARLVIATARSAMLHGADLATYTRVIGLERSGGEVRGAVVEDEYMRQGQIRAAVVVNATGPWTDGIRRLEDPGAKPMLRRTRGAHVMVRRERIGHTAAVTLTSPIDGRVMFVLPWGEFSYIGTTDTDEPGPPEAAAPSEDDVHYLLRSANACFPQAHLTEEDVVSSWAGVRALIDSGEPGTASSVSREHVIRRGPGGMLTIAGGKLTTYRSMAAELVDEVAAELTRREGRPRPSRAPTDTEPLPGGEAADLDPMRQTMLDLGLGAETADHLLRHYGTEAAAICNLGRLERGLLERLHPDHPAIEAEVVHHARRELATHIDDVLVRRIHLHYETTDHGAQAAPKVAALLGRELNWDEGRVRSELAGWQPLSQPVAPAAPPGAAASPPPPATPA
ncbi:MAG: glycerol-3-phosphate dehydrogenase [Gemmatimonadales bacterium]